MVVPEKSGQDLTDAPPLNDAGRLEDIPAKPEMAVTGRMIVALFAEMPFFRSAAYITTYRQPSRQI